MSAPPPALLPLFRSSNQLRLLAALLLEPTRAFTITELAVAAGVPQPSVSREVSQLLRTGVLVTTQDRGRKLVQANTDSPIFPELASLLRKTTGPRSVLERLLAGLPGVDEAFIYGSWARRYSGEIGPQPADIDVLVVGRPDVGEVRHRTESASSELGRDVNVNVVSPEEWSAAGSGWLAHVRSSPLVRLDVSSPAPSTSS